MEKTCVKCGHTSTLKNVDSLSECPRCGAIYAKAEAAQEERRQPEEKVSAERPSSGGRSVLAFLVLGGLACLIFSHYRGNGPARKQQKQAAKAVVAQQKRPTSRMVRRRPLPGRVLLARKEKEVNEPEFQEKPEATGIQESKVADAGENPAPVPTASPATTPTTTVTTKTTVKKVITYYLAESTISQGGRVDLTEHLSKGRYTVFYFYAEW